MRKILSASLAFLLVILLLTGCTPAKQAKQEPTLNGTVLSAYTIVYSDKQPDYDLRAAQYIQTQIKARTGLELAVSTDSAGTYGHEIVVGETGRAISSRLTVDTQNVEFAILADGSHIAMEGDYFVIAAAAYYFVETYIPGKDFNTTVPQTVSVHSPITKAPKNFIFLIGDGMGVNHTKLLEEYTIANAFQDSDNEKIFYGNYLPYQGTVHTNSLSGVTDSAAAATALACGYKTNNAHVGMDPEGNELLSLTELAALQGKATAIMSTDNLNGATPAGFTAHAMDRDDSKTIQKCIQKRMQAGTLVDCGLDSSRTYQDIISQTLTKLNENEKGFFLMYEEGHIDKHSHKNDIKNTLICVGRFNQAIGIFMEYAFYHPETFLIITADHETGGLTPGKDGKLGFTTEDHTAVDVPIYGYGQGTEIFQDRTIENTQIPKEIAKLWGITDFGDQSAE